MQFRLVTRFDRISDMGIRNKSVLCLMAVLFPVTVIGLFAIHLVGVEAVSSTKNSLRNVLHLELERIELKLEEYEKNAKALASRRSVRIFFTELDRYRQSSRSTAAEPAKERPLIRGHGRFSMVDPEAPWPLQQLALNLQIQARATGTAIVEMRLVDRYNEVLGESIGYSWSPVDSALVEQAMLANSTQFGDAFVNHDDKQRLGIVSPVVSQSGEVVGAILMEALLDPLTHPLSKYENEDNFFEAHLAQPTLKGDAQLLSSQRLDQNAAFNLVVPAEESLAINKALDSPLWRTLRAADYHGVESYLAMQTVARVGWGLVIRVDADHVHAPSHRLRNRLAWATLVSIGCVALIYMFIVGPVVNRLNKAAAAARQIMDGNLSVRVIDSRNDEISELSGSINSLARDLEADQRIRTEVEARLRHQAAHDELTGLLNRKHANKVIDKLTADRSQEHTVIFLDLDGFKDVNDSYGHAAGDEVLVKIARRLRLKVPSQATLARWGGDEFVIILPATGKHKAAAFALQLYKAFDNTIVSSKGRHKIRCSFGLATSNKKKTLHEALSEADSQMYVNKNQRKLYGHDIRRTKTARGMKQALPKNRIVDVAYEIG